MSLSFFIMFSQNGITGYGIFKSGKMFFTAFIFHHSGRFFVDDVGKERLMVSIATLAGISCIIQGYFGGWEFWMPLVIVLGDIALWWIHFTGKMDIFPRITLYFVYAALLAFYQGVHENTLFDISVAFALFFALVTMADRAILLNLSFALYGIIMAIQIYFLYRKGWPDINAFNIMRIVFHVATIVVLYIFSRIVVVSRTAEKESLDQWKKAVDANDNDMEDFLSNVSHELRTPVNVIGGMTAILQKSCDGAELDAIQDAGRRLAYQIEDIKDYTEIMRDEMVIEDEQYDCVSMINDVVAGYNALYRDSGLALCIDLSAEIPTMLNGDVKKLVKILRHIIDNAMKFTSKGGVCIRVYSEPKEYGINLIIEVADTGIGMTRAQMSNISKGMYQANKKRNRSTGGIGIGLPIVYGFVHKMGGFVMVHSDKRNGTRVRISVPQKVVNPAPCLAVKDSFQEGFLFYHKPDKYKVPALREFYKNMALNLATGIGREIYSANGVKELEHILDREEVFHIFTGQEEYLADRNVLERLAAEGYKVVVAVDRGFAAPSGSKVILVPRPLYAFPIVRILNGDYSAGDASVNSDKRLLLSKVSALVVDDEPMNLTVATGLFREYEMSVDTARSGKEALNKFARSDYDIIFMDHMMPEMDGVEAMKLMREMSLQREKKPVIVALTANALSGAKEMFMKEGFDGFIAKPIDLYEFERVMKKVLPDELISYEGRAAL